MITFKKNFTIFCILISTVQLSFTQNEKTINTSTPHEHASNISPEEKVKIEKDSDERIAKEMGTSVTVASFNSFLEKSLDKIKQIGDKIPTNDEVNEVKQATVDIIRAYAKLPKNEQTKELKKKMLPLVANLTKFEIQIETVRKIKNKQA